MKQYTFGTLPDGRTVTAYEFGNDTLRAVVLNYGGIAQKLVFNGTDVIGGYDDIEGYLVSDGYQGALIGRYANRIKGGRFSLNGETVQLAVNEAERGNHIHGGAVGFDKRIWNAEPFSDKEGEGVILTLHSPDGEEGYPGNMDVKVTYRINGGDYSIHYEAKTDRDTVFNMTNHSYYNMNGIAGGAIYDQTLQINSEKMSVVDGNLIPTGTCATAGTPFDFRAPKLLSKELMDCDDEQMKFGAGLDHNFYITGTDAALFEGRRLVNAATFAGKLGAVTLYTDTPCVQFYAGNFMAGDYPFKGGLKREKQHALCLETQYAPDGPNRGEAILRAGEKYDFTALFRFH